MGLVPTHLRNRHLALSDAVSLIASALLAFLVRFEDVSWISSHPRLVGLYIGITVPLRMLLFYEAGMYRRLWRHASVGELRQIVLAGAAAAVISWIVGIWLIPATHLVVGRVPFSVVFIDAFLTVAAISLPRVLARTIRTGRRRRHDDPGRRVLIVGAGDTAKLVVKELHAGALNLEPVGFVDDDKRKHGQMLLGLPIFGPVSAVRSLIDAHSIAEIIIAMPSASGSVIREVVRAAIEAGIPTLTVPSLPEIISKHRNMTSLREVEIQDLLRRDPIETDLASVAALATGETVLVTGAGGSIGSELCRQLARLAPSRLILLGHGENSIFDIREELTRSFPDVTLVPVIADVRDRRRIHEVFRMYPPHAVFHAAAHKHVPLMEDNLIEAVTNNIIGTRNVVDAAVDSDVQHFVLISTDKAVRPTSVMGATKRVAELVVQHAAMKHGRNFGCVRFGNVLGSRGSVVPIFLRQIRNGGPITITHPEMQRYFMTIPEAVQLVLQAGALGEGGEVFLLDMGEPIRIVDIAADLIRLSGLAVGTDVKIAFTGMRPGEKLYEEMFFSAENVLPTNHPKLLKARNAMVAEGFSRRLDGLCKIVEGPVQDGKLCQLLNELVPDFHRHVPQESSEQPQQQLESTLGMHRA